MPRSLFRAFILTLAGALAVAIAAPQLSAQASKAPDSVVLKGAPMGGVKLMHTAHTKDRNVKCTQCHHPSKAEKPMKGENQKCSDCHTKAAAAPMKTTIQAAFHDKMAKTGTCIDCHVKENAAGKKAPTKCNECHKKENV